MQGAVSIMMYSQSFSSYEKLVSSTSNVIYDLPYFSIDNACIIYTKKV